jgi:hypothetical protein
LVLGEDLAHLDIRDVRGGLDDISKYPRREGQTAFPELATLKAAIIERKLVREANEARRQEAEEIAYAKAHPEEFMSAKDFWDSAEVLAIVKKAKGIA